MANILFFGPLQDLMGVKSLSLKFNKSPVYRQDIIAHVADGQTSLIDALGAISVRMIADKIIVEDGFDFSQSEEIAFLPPMSGG